MKYKPSTIYLILLFYSPPVNFFIITITYKININKYVNSYLNFSDIVTLRK